MFVLARNDIHPDNSFSGEVRPTTVLSGIVDSDLKYNPIVSECQQHQLTRFLHYLIQQEVTNVFSSVAVVVNLDGDMGVDRIVVLDDFVVTEPDDVYGNDGSGLDDAAEAKLLAYSDVDYSLAWLNGNGPGDDGQIKLVRRNTIFNSWLKKIHFEHFLSEALIWLWERKKYLIINCEVWKEYELSL